jgi:NhaP-type Na+/H+ or K+/H+ antiporter
LASPTDPSIALAVEHEYHAEGEVASAIMEVAAFDDILGIIHYSLSVSIAGMYILHQPMGIYSVATPLIKISGSIILGCLFGLLLNFFTKIFNKRTEGKLITLIIGLLALCFGLSEALGLDKLLPTMVMGIIVVNFNSSVRYAFCVVFNVSNRCCFKRQKALKSAPVDSMQVSNRTVLTFCITIAANIAELAVLTLDACFPDSV